eukprot:7741323-Pyramimonas_sp.AAC.1
MPALRCETLRGPCVLGQAWTPALLTACTRLSTPRRHEQGNETSVRGYCISASSSSLVVLVVAVDVVR